MNMSYLRAFVLTLIFALLFPAVASAKWWNPASWKKKAVPETIQVVQETFPPATATTTPVATTTPAASPVDDLEKRINDLLKENSDLKNEIAKYRKNANSCKLELEKKTAALATARVEFSDYKFQYSWDGRTMKIASPSPRQLLIKEFEFKIKDTSSTLTAFLGEESIEDLYASINGEKYNLIRFDRAFKYTGKPIKIDGTTTITIVVKGQSGNTYFTDPVLSKWLIWDETSNKQVRIGY